MNTIKELSSLSTYRPTNGDTLYLFHLMMDKDLSRKESEIRFIRQNKSVHHFRVVYKNLKDNLLEGILSNSFKDYTKIQQAHFKIWKKFVKSKILIQSEKKTAGATVAKEALLGAEKYGILEIALSLSRELEMHYANIEPDQDQYNRFKEKVNIYQLATFQETTAQSTFSELAFCIKKQKECSHIPALIQELEAL